MGDTPLVIDDALERLETLKTVHTFVTWVFKISLIVGVFAAVGVDKPIETPYSSFVWWQVTLPCIGIAVLWVMANLWGNKRNKSWRTLYSVAAIGWLIPVTVLIIYNTFIDLIYLCPQNKPIYCTDGVTSDIKAWYWVYFFATWVHWLTLLIDIVIAYQISKKIQLLLNPLTGTTRDDVIALLDTPGGMRWLNAIGKKV